MRSRGSHSYFAIAGGRTTIVPAHSGEVLGPCLLRSIVRIVRDVELGADNLF
jgi:predicted RNA binding protein YcfA (HicA-like mRNA interferase family)